MYNVPYCHLGKDRVATLSTLLTGIKTEPGGPGFHSASYKDIKTGELGQHVLLSNQPVMLVN